MGEHDIIQFIEVDGDGNEEEWVHGIHSSIVPREGEEVILPVDGDRYDFEVVGVSYDFDGLAQAVVHVREIGVREVPTGSLRTKTKELHDHS